MTNDPRAQSGRPEIDWVQYQLNGGSYCLHVEDGKYCGRAQAWDGHDGSSTDWPFHTFVAADSVNREIDLLFRLRAETTLWTHPLYLELRCEAADEIERIRAALAATRAERDALAALVDEFIEHGRYPDLYDRARALRAGQQKGGAMSMICRKCGVDIYATSAVHYCTVVAPDAKDAEIARLTRELDELRVKYDALQRGYFGLLRDSAPHQFASLQAGDPNYCAICGEARGHLRHDVYVGPLPAAPNEVGKP